jgi:cell division septal protein FtsQ
MTDTPLRRPRPTAGVPAPADKRFRRSSHRPGRRRGWQFWAVRAGLFAGAVAITTTLLWVLGNGVMYAGVFDLEEYRGRLLDSRWIENATLWRVFPSSIHVEVVERAPLAIGRLNGRFYLVDRAGVIDEAGPKYAELDLPVVDGLFPEGDGAMPDPARVDLLSRFLADIETTAGLRHRVSQIDVSDARNAVVLIDNEPARLQLGMSDFGARLLRYFEAYEAAQRRVAVADYYDLRFGDRIYVGPARLVRDARH